MPSFRDRFAQWLAAYKREVHQLHGIAVYVENTRPDIATPDVLARLDEALALIEQYQPWRLRHLQRDLRQILVIRYPCRGAYIPSERTCITELTFLARRDISAAVVASSIVHEGIHARIDRFRQTVGTGIRGDDMPREERLCRKAELAFGQALPADLGAPVVERALASLTLADQEVAPAIDWNVARARQEAIDAEAAKRFTK
ncbi:MAG TPA: hypothetical protein VHB25_21360 [Gemmatimonadaceae bacterium]|nr:hypothetical protein [Gemmatimonadaceae bacterium]